MASLAVGDSYAVSSPETTSPGVATTVPNQMKRAQSDWNTRSIKDRVRVLRRFRREMALQSATLANAISSDLSRTSADTRVAEILPLLAACRFLEDQAERILTVQRLGRRGLPFWLAGIDTEVHRVPFGNVLVIGPSNYPLFIPGVQVLQALVSGNAVTWKPGRGGRAVAKVFESTMLHAGLPDRLLLVTEDTVEATTSALESLPDKVFFTGSAEVGRILMKRLADTLTPCVLELSGCDAVIVLPSADILQVIRALTFGMRLNGSETCMAPRRILFVDATPERRHAFVQGLQTSLSQVTPIRIRPVQRQQVEELLYEARLEGAEFSEDINVPEIQPVLVMNVRPEMRLAQADIFVPVLSMIDVAGEAGILAAQEACPFALTAAIFGDEKDARRLAQKLVAGCILINDIIVATADPRLAFGGRRSSGFGVTRGIEGLLEMTAVKTVVVRRGNSQRHYEATTPTHADLFDGLIAAFHSRSWMERLAGLKQVTVAGKLLAAHKRTEEQHGK